MPAASKARVPETRGALSMKRIVWAGLSVLIGTGVGCQAFLDGWSGISSSGKVGPIVPFYETFLDGSSVIGSLRVVRAAQCPRGSCPVGVAYEVVGGTALVGTISPGEILVVVGPQNGDVDRAFELIQVNKSSFSLKSGLDRELAGPPGTGVCGATPETPFLASRAGIVVLDAEGTHYSLECALSMAASEQRGAGPSDGPSVRKGCRVEAEEVDRQMAESVERVPERSAGHVTTEPNAEGHGGRGVVTCSPAQVLAPSSRAQPQSGSSQQ